VHAFAGAASTFFIPALSTSLGLFAVKKLLSQRGHVIAVLNVSKVGSQQFKLVAAIVHYFIVGQTARSYSTYRAGFQADPR
jgi:uncharacterized membrane protein YiaA